MNKISALLAAIGLALAMTPAAADERPVLAELFTSEGCSSCPPADALLAELAARPALLALSFHVDYWDRLGWKDPFSSAWATGRQRRYADLLSLATVYTPQMVIDGKWQAVGSNRGAVETALATAVRERDAVPVALTVDHGRVRIVLGSSGAATATVLLVGFDRRRASAVARGENAGRNLAHVDVVGSLEEVGQFDGRARTIERPIPVSSERIAAIVQAQDGRVLGTAVSDTATP